MSIVPPPVAWGLFITAVIISRILQERALARLSTEAKGRLVEAFSAYRMIGLVPLAAIAALYFLMASLDAFTTRMMLAIYVLAALVFAGVMHVLIYRKLRAMSVDAGYVRTYSLTRWLTIVAFALLLLAA